MFSFNSPLYVSGNFNLIQGFFNTNSKVIYVGDPGAEMMDIRQYNMLIGGVLIPPYEILSMDLDNDPNFDNIYWRYLYSSAEVNQYLATIMCALYKNINVPIVLYFPGDTFTSFRYPTVLLGYLNSFGITPSIITEKGYSQCQYNINSNFIAEYMYINGAITSQEYIIISDNITQFAAQKLRQEYNLGNLTDENMVAWYQYNKNNLTY